MRDQHQNRHRGDPGYNPFEQFPRGRIHPMRIFIDEQHGAKTSQRKELID
jgi:hypothetical protein